MSLLASGSGQVSARTEYAVRAAIGLASGGAEVSHTARELAETQHIPHRFLLNILADLRRHRIVTSRRGPEGGWRLARPADSITVADIVQAVDGPLPEQSATLVDGAPHSPTRLEDVWLAAQASAREILEHVTVADLVAVPEAGTPADAIPLQAITHGLPGELQA
jgi:Rrf2 family protein